MVEPIGRTAWAELAEHLATMIVNGEMSPGQRLVESELAERFNISRGPVRSALAWLERNGLAQPVGRRGLVVVEMTPTDVRELYSVRIALEEAAIREVCELGTTNVDWTPMRTALDELEDASKGPEPVWPDVIDADIAFHRGLVELTGNRRLVRAWDSLADQIRLVIRILRAEDAETTAPLTADHRRIYEALRSPDPVGATESLRRHLLGTRDAMMAILERGAARAASSK